MYTVVINLKVKNTHFLEGVVPGVAVVIAKTPYLMAKAMATRTSPSKRCNEQNNGCARALQIFVLFLTVLCKATRREMATRFDKSELLHITSLFPTSYRIDCRRLGNCEVKRQNIHP